MDGVVYAAALGGATVLERTMCTSSTSSSNVRKTASRSHVATGGSHKELAHPSHLSSRGGLETQGANCPSQVIDVGHFARRARDGSAPRFHSLHLRTYIDNRNDAGDEFSLAEENERDSSPEILGRGATNNLKPRCERTNSSSNKLGNLRNVQDDCSLDRLHFQHRGK